MRAKTAKTNPWLTLVSGPPAAGKTTLARKIASEFRLPLVSKDAIKETLFDTLGWSDRAWSQRLGLASINLMFEFIERQLEAGQSVVAEKNLSPQFDAPRLSALSETYGVNILELFCIAEPATLLDRYERRLQTGERHPGHDLSIEEYRRALAEIPPQPIRCGRVLLTVDTTDFSRIDCPALFQAIRAALEEMQ